MLNYNLNIIEPLKQDKKNEDVRPPIYWSFTSIASASDSTDLGELGFATMSIQAPNTNCIQVSNDASGYFTTDAQYPVTASITGSNWPVTGSTTMSLYTAGITYDPASVNQYYYAAISASALDIFNNPNITGSKLLNNFSASEFFRFYVEGNIVHWKGNQYNPLINWLAKNESPSTNTGNVNGFTASFNIVKDANVSLVSLPQVTGSKVGAFNNEYALNITSSLSASIINDATGSTTMSISIPEAGILTSSLLFNSSSAGLQTISASFTASNNNPYNITASVIMNKGNIWNASVNYLITGSSADSYSMYTIPTHFNLIKDVNVDGAVINQNVVLLNYDVNSVISGQLQTQYAFNFQNDITESGTYPIYQVHTFPTTSLILTPAGTSSVRYDSGSIISYTEFPYTSSYNLTASAWINKIPAVDATIIVLGGGGGAGRSATNPGSGYNVGSGGGGAGGFFQWDFSLMPNKTNTIVSIGAAGTGSATVKGQDGGTTRVDLWLGPINEAGTGSILSQGGFGSTASLFNGPGGASGVGYISIAGETYYTKDGLAGGAGSTSDGPGGGGGIYQTGSSFTLSAFNNGGLNLGGGGGAGEYGGGPGSGSGFPTIFFHSASFISITGSSGAGGNLNSNGNSSTVFGGGGGGAGVSTNGTNYRGGDGGAGVVILAYSGSSLLTQVPDGTITRTSNGYTYHIFTKTGSFSWDVAPKPNPTEQKYIWRAESLVIAGGGNGGSDQGGGGGAGGYSYNPYTWFTIGNQYNITIGAGAPSSSLNAAPYSGSNSYIVDQNGTTLIFAKGGGNGWAHPGGSGGGATNSGNGGSNAPGYITQNYYVTGSQLQGFPGGAAADEPSANAGGGGGAANSGSSGTFDGPSGVGGIGKYTLDFVPIGVCGGGNANSANDSSPNVTIFGGGRGAQGGIQTGSAATSFGSGGGGAYGVGQAGGAGGNGLVQIRYAGTQRATGGQIQTGLISGSYYTLHTFTASGVFTPTA